MAYFENKPINRDHCCRDVKLNIPLTLTLHDPNVSIT